jgi:hypothetical protein
MIYVDSELVVSSPGSPPGMTASKSSKSSSFKSFHSDDNSVLADASHFEDIGLDDDAVHFDSHHLRDTQIKPPPPNPYSPEFSADLRAASFKSLSRPLAGRELPKNRSYRDITPSAKTRPPFPSLQTQVRSISGRSSSLHGQHDHFAGAIVPRGLVSRSTTSLPFSRRHRSPSPNFSLQPRDVNLFSKPRRSSWQSNRERKSALELERECDEDDGDDIPEGLILDNVPISPRPIQERPQSRPSSLSPSPERSLKENPRKLGNGTPPVALAQGSLRSPTWKSDSALTDRANGRPPVHSGPIPLKTRAKSWNAALADLSAEAKALTAKLEEHADECGENSTDGTKQGASGDRSTRRSVDYLYEAKQKKTVSMPEIPPLRRTNIMIDPLPISKEKEAVLSRTRPSWLPPKDPAEERRHLREYQKMMAYSAQADRRREASRRTQVTTRDSNADALMRTWELDILPRWNDAIRERRTRELWWRGVAPRSRGAVWTRAIGNELGLSEASYLAALNRAKDTVARVQDGRGDAEDIRRASWITTIRKEVDQKTWKDLQIFQVGAPLHESLVDILSAYSMYRNDIGYMTGSNVRKQLPNNRLILF